MPTKKKIERKVEYSSNNSGGDWWLKDEHWFALEKAGWKVNWIKDDPYHLKWDRGDRWLGALATRAERIGLTLKEAVSEWEDVTGLSSTDAGCPCCGQPHYFSYYENDKYISSGPNTSYECEW